MIDALHIRPPVQGDFDRWLPLWQGYNEFYGRSGTTALPSDVTSATWVRFFDPDQPVHALVAESGDELVGLVHYLYHRSTTSIADVCYLQDLFTAESARGRGIASTLIARVAEEARLAGAARVYWQTHETNHTARRLYDAIAERSGFLVYRMTL